MFGYRTPVKDLTKKTDSSPKEDGNKKLTEGAGPPTKLEYPTTSKVRRSIGEIESRQRSPRSKKQEPEQPEETTRAKPPTGGQKLTFSQKVKVTSGTTEKSPKPVQYKSRTSEAKACLLRAKIKIDQSRNLKTDIKNDVLEAVERLYSLVKEAENANQTEAPSPHPRVSRDPPEHNTFVAQLEEQSALLRENNRKIDELKEMVEQQNNRGSYASVTAGHCPGTLPNRRETLHSVVVTSTDETETGEEVLGRVRKAVDAKDGWVTVQRVRKAKDRKIILGFKSKDDQNKVKERLQGNQLVVEEIQNKDPLLVLRDVLLANTDDDVLRALRNQNKDIFRGLDKDEQRIEIRYRRKARNPLTGHIVISTSPRLWKRALEQGALHVDLQRIRVADQSPLVQCTRCLGYGHNKRVCKEAADLCGHCGGPHLRAECVDWLAGSAPTCKNCTRSGRDQTGHNAFDRECPVRQKWDALARSAVAYC